MANSLGSLRVLLGLDAAEFTRGLTKAEYQAQQFSRNVSNSIKSIAGVLGGLAIGQQVYESTKAIIGEAAALNDLADATGSSVESLSRLNNQAKIAGTDFATMQAAVLKLSQGMAGADEESNKAKEALRILGVTTKDPVQALQEVAVKLNTYADGVNKVGFATALFGKQGAQFLATLKDIAELQDVGATVTAKQAAEAENLEKAFRRLSVESTGFKNAILNEVVPALVNLIEEMKAAQSIAGSFLGGIVLKVNAESVDKAGARIRELQGEIEQLRKPSIFGEKENPAEIAAREREIAFLKERIRLNALSKISPDDTNVRDQILLRKPAAPNPPGSGTAKAIKEQISDTDRYVASLLKQLEGTLDLNDAEKAEVEIYNLLARGVSDLTEEKKALIRDLAQQITYTKEAEKAAKEQAKAEEEAAKAQERFNERMDRVVDATQRQTDSIAQSNEHTREQIIFLRGGQDALDAYTAAKVEATAAELDHTAAVYEQIPVYEEQAKALRQQAAALRERNRLAGEAKLAEQLAKEAKALQDVKNLFADSFANAFSDFITGTKSARDAFKAFADDIFRQLSRLASQGIANAIFGGNNAGGPDVFGILAKFLPTLFGLGGGGGFSFSGGGFGEHFASGGVSRGGLALVGENGPELRELAAGDRIYSNADTRRMLGGSGGDVHVHQAFYVTGQVDSRTARQMAREASAAVSVAGSRG